MYKPKKNGIYVQLLRLTGQNFLPHPYFFFLFLANRVGQSAGIDPTLRWASLTRIEKLGGSLSGLDFPYQAVSSRTSLGEKEEDPHKPEKTDWQLQPAEEAEVRIRSMIRSTMEVRLHIFLRQKYANHFL